MKNKKTNPEINPKTNPRTNPEINPKTNPRTNPKTNTRTSPKTGRTNPETSPDYNLLSIQDCARLYNLSTVTIRKWIKKNQLPASIISNQYLISREAIEKLLEEKGLIRINPRTNTETNPETNTRTSPKEVQISPESSPIREETSLFNELKKENEYLKEKINTMEHTISILQQGKEFLQGQVQQLTNTISLLTTKQLPEPKGVMSKIKGWFRKE